MWPWSRRTVASEIRRLAMRMRRPHAVRLMLVRKETERMALVYSVTAAPSLDADVVARQMAVIINGEASGMPTDFPPETTSFGEIIVPQDAQVVVTLVDIDDAGNVSEPAVLEFTAIDTIPPAKPGEFGVTLVRETA
jgi:hypothetical protein